MGVAWSHCPLCELKQVPGSLPLPPPCVGALGHLPHVLPPATSALHQELPQRPWLPTPPIPAQICTLQGIFGVRGEGRDRGGAAVLCILTPVQPHSAPW